MASGTVTGLVRSSNPSTVRFVAWVAIGATGAATVSQNGGTYITCTKNNTGIYTMTFPPFAVSTTSMCSVNVRVTKSAAITVVDALVTAIDPAAGTATFKTLLADAAAEPANGDTLKIVVEGQKTGGIF
jgi:hypothetical protein